MNICVPLQLISKLSLLWLYWKEESTFPLHYAKCLSTDLLHATCLLVATAAQPASKDHINIAGLSIKLYHRTATPGWSGKLN